MGAHHLIRNISKTIKTTHAICVITNDQNRNPALYSRFTIPQNQERAFAITKHHMLVLEVKLNSALNPPDAMAIIAIMTAIIGRAKDNRIGPIIIPLRFVAFEC